MGKVLVSASHFDTLGKEAWELLTANGHEVIYDPNRAFPAYSFEELKEIIGDIDAALIGMDKYTEEVFQLAPKLKAVAKFGVGVDNIDGLAAKKYGIKVLNAPGQNSNAVAEMCVAFILDLLRRIVPLHGEVLQGKWPRFVGAELKGKTVGLLGFGAISKLVARKLLAFEAKIIAFDLYTDVTKAGALEVEAVTLEDLIARSDILSLHIPATSETRHMFNDETFAKMKPGAFLINTARGALVDADALVRALHTGQIAGAAIDVFEPEPLPPDSPLLRCENVILTPHTGAETVEAYQNVSLTTARDIIAVLRGDEPLHCTNR